ncbi:hypothetical protein [Rhizobium wuzhouense]|uniref:HTH cro/C1-type domain-containing protein n=1 Tax=Rhizobium wuzhouense TaxID=1986026 RepID=A0ABX5NWM1_9HYPH|nr:hypothetical protein [Rhizobium wuzhouense]PYB77573.1 hypothetical protein DMY87_04270 [Rhizobium wuzhouense]
MNGDCLTNLIAREMEAKQISIEALADRMQLSAILVERVVSGSAKLPLDQVKPLAVALKIDLNEVCALAFAQHFGLQAQNLLRELLVQATLSDAENEWLDLLRAASPSNVAPPSRIGKRLIHSLLGGGTAAD